MHVYELEQNVYTGSMNHMQHNKVSVVVFENLERNVVLLNDRLWVYPLKRDRSFLLTFQQTLKRLLQLLQMFNFRVKLIQTKNINLFN